MEGDYTVSHFRWNGGGASAGSSTVFTEVTGNLQFTDDDIRAVYVDWDDGTSNKKTESNYQWVELAQPTGSIDVKHTYTATGTFKPVVQTINSKGFFSKYYSSDSTNTDITPYAQSTDMENIVIADTAATGIMKMENRTVKTGIDNSIFDVEGSKKLFLAVAPTLTQAELAVFCETGSATTGSIQIDVKCILDYGVRGNKDITPQPVNYGAGGERIIQTLPVVLSGANLTGSVVGLRNILASGAHDLTALVTGATVAQVLEVKYKNPKYAGADRRNYTKNEVYNKLKIFLVAYSESLGKYVPVTYITAGDPIKKYSDVLRNTTLDFSQSRAAASNISIARYRYDLGKSWFQSAKSWTTGSATTFSDRTEQVQSTKPISYTYMTRPNGLNGSSSQTAFTTTTPWNTNNAASYIEDQYVMDDYSRFVPQYHMTRMSAEPSSSAANVSTITDNKPAVLRITPAVSWTYQSDGTSSSSAVNARIFPTTVINSGTNASKSKDYTAAAFNNVSGSSGIVDLAGMNGMTFYDSGLSGDDSGGGGDASSNTRTAKEYLLMLFDKKTNNIFFNITNHADNITSDPNTAPAYGIAGVYYLAVTDKGTPKQNAYWQPVEFNDTTAVTREFRNTTTDSYDTVKYSLAKSGYVSFDMPLDWESINVSGACGGQYYEPVSATTGSYDYGIMTVSHSSFTAGTNVGDYATYSISANDVPTASGMTSEDIGSFKYIFIPTAPSSQSGSAYWVTADGANGYSTGTLKVNVGESGSYNGGTGEYDATAVTHGYIRRINIYDIIDGFSKIYRKESGAYNKLYNVDSYEGDSALNFNNLYCLNSLSDISLALGNSTGPASDPRYWVDDKYLLKVVLSGTVTSDNLYPEIWNVFDGTRGYSSAIKEVDNSAYNLNSLAIVSDVSVTRAGNYFQAITRKGKVFIARVGTPIQTISFDSVALGNSESGTAFEDYGDPSQLYGHLHMIRKAQADNVRVYWDEPQKDGTFVRFWGIITNVDETLGTGGSNSILAYSFNMIVEEIALLDKSNSLMTDVFPLGSIENDRNYT